MALSPLCKPITGKSLLLPCSWFALYVHSWESNDILMSRGHFLLAHLLLDKLIETGTEGGDARSAQLHCSHAREQPMQDINNA